MYLICHVTSQDRLIKESCDHMEASSSRYVLNLPSLLGMSIEEVEISCFYLVT